MNETKSVDMRPRRIWFGITIPGKKMMRLLEPYLPGNRGANLLDLYKAPPYEALLYVALALQLMPKRGFQFGPAARQFVSGSQKFPTLYGATLTDMRDFLKLRFRAKGYPQSEGGSSDITLERLASGNFPESVQSGLPEEVINYTISALDLLSRQSHLVYSENVNVEVASEKLKELLRTTGESVFDTKSIPDRYLKESWDNIFTQCKE
jgi:hypothetical protein